MEKNPQHRIAFISHTPYSHRFFQTGLGEVGNCKKFKDLLDQEGFCTGSIMDIYQLFGGKNGKGPLNKIAAMNFHLGAGSHSLLDDLDTPLARKVFHKVKTEVQSSSLPPLLMALTFNWNTAALVGTGIGKIAPFIAKCYLPDYGSVIYSKIFESVDLVVTECLFVNLFGALCGIPPWKMLYLPHHFPSQTKQIYEQPSSLVKEKKEAYLRRIASLSGKPCHITDKTVVAGLVSRFSEGKHTEYAIEAFEKCVNEGMDAVLVLKGGYDNVILGSSQYKQRLKNLLKRVSTKHWFYWDKEFTPFPDVLGIYRLFDLCLLFSAIEGASNSVVELMALGRPCLLLKENTNPCLFNGAAAWVEPAKEFATGKKSYRLPDCEDACKQLKRLLNDASERERLGQRAREIALQRFPPSLTLERMPLLMAAASSYHFGTADKESLQSLVVQQLKQDLELYQIPLDITLEQLITAQLPQASESDCYAPLLVPKPLFHWG